MTEPIVIVGGGQAGASAAAKIRELAPDMPITLICEEPVLPYQRPPLSKKYLSGEMPLDRLLLRPQEWFDQHAVDVRINSLANAIDRANHTVSLVDGSKVTYSKLLLATGSNVRRLPDAIGGSLKGVYHLRTKIDADDKRPELKAGNHLLVVGGGYIGLEVAAVASQLGMKVTILEMADRILQRVAAPETSDYFRNLHASNGVTIRESTGLARLLDEEGKVSGAELSNGEILNVDCVLVGIGILPVTSLAEQAGLQIENGVAVDDHCRTSDPDIFAAGDCASFVWKGNRIRLESVPNAIHQAEVAVENMLGGEVAYLATPWFWSDQYEVKLQIAGLNSGYDDTVNRAGKREGSQSVWYYKGEQLLAVDAMNDAPSFMMARRILEANKNVPKSVAEDPNSNLKDWM